MKIIDYKDLDCVNYKLLSMYIIMPTCSFKCDKECGRPVCQNSELAHMPSKEISVLELIDIFDANPLTEAIVFGGLEPLDSSTSLLSFVMSFRYNHPHPIVIYTGYTEEEVKKKFEWITLYENMVVKFGRYIPDQPSHFDRVLGVKLASPNQYAKEFNPL